VDRDRHGGVRYGSDIIEDLGEHMKYVIIDGRVTPCRAADPEHCRYHVGATHYASKHDATAELEREIMDDVHARADLRKDDGMQSGADLQALALRYDEEHRKRLVDRRWEELSDENEAYAIRSELPVRRVKRKYGFIYADDDPVSCEYLSALESVHSDAALRTVIKTGSPGAATIAFLSMHDAGKGGDISETNAVQLASVTDPIIVGDDPTNFHTVSVLEDAAGKMTQADLISVMTVTNDDDHVPTMYALEAARMYKDRYGDKTVIDRLQDHTIDPRVIVLNDHDLTDSSSWSKTCSTSPELLAACLTAADGHVNKIFPGHSDYSAAERIYRLGPDYAEAARIAASDSASRLNRAGDKPSDGPHDAVRLAGYRSDSILAYGSRSDADREVMTAMFSHGSFKNEPAGYYDADEDGYVEDYDEPDPSDNDYRALALGCKNGWISDGRLVELAEHGGFGRFFMESSCAHHISASVKRTIRKIVSDSTPFSKY
jgi:hypothetical protein